MESDGVRSVVLRRTEGLGLGFSIMGGAGYEFPPVIYGIEKDSPAARSGLLEAGDIILAINEREVVKLSTKEVLKCLRLSGDIVHIKYKRDPHVVSRVRHFLSTPHYSDVQEHQHFASSPLKQPNVRSSKTSQIPVYQHYHTSPLHSPTRAPPSAEEPNHITFADDLFINHHHSHHHQQQQQQRNNQQNSGHNDNKNGRKNCETFLMTGDAILNLSRKDSNDAYRPSPTKTTSKLTPMPQMPIFVERECQEQRRLQLDRERDKSESPPHNSDILPPPPPPHDNSRHNSISTKSDNLPPPPPPEDSSSLKNGHEPRLTRMDNGGAPNDDECRQTQNNCDNVKVNHNNEDTSISSSVMSDSVDEDIEVDEDVQNMVAADTHPDQNRIVLKVEAEKNGDDAEVVPVVPEKERYCEYILLNGSPQSVAAEERSSAEDYQRQVNFQIGKMADTNSKEEEEEEEEMEDSELGMVGAGGEHLSSIGVGSGGSGGSFSGGESDSSDVESMQQVPVVKAVDLPSAERLAKRLFTLDGFKMSDVWRQLSKSNDFSRAVAVEYLKYFNFEDQHLDVSLRKFLAVCPLRGETQERERVLSYFSTRFVECCPNVFASQDSVHTLTCALMLLNTDMYSGSRSGRRMTCSEFIENLSGLNDGADFPVPILKQLYHSIKSQPLVSPQEVEDEDSNKDILPMDMMEPVPTPCMEFKRGYLMRKSTFEMGGKKTPLGKRSWKMYFCRLKELLLVLSHDETSKSCVQNTVPIKLHHAIAATASDYRKRQHVFRLIMADRSQLLFQSSDTREMNSWIEMINWNAARYSSPALEAPCSSSGRYERPLLPSSVTRMSPRDQIVTHQSALQRWEQDLQDLNQPRVSKKDNNKRDYKEKVTFFQFEIRRYRTYMEILDRRVADGLEGPEVGDLQELPNPPPILMEMEELS